MDLRTGYLQLQIDKGLYFVNKQNGRLTQVTGQTSFSTI